MNVIVVEMFRKIFGLMISSVGIMIMLAPHAYLLYRNKLKLLFPGLAFLTGFILMRRADLASGWDGLGWGLYATLAYIAAGIYLLLNAVFRILNRDGKVREINEVNDPDPGEIKMMGLSGVSFPVKRKSTKIILPEDMGKRKKAAVRAVVITAVLPNALAFIRSMIVTIWLSAALSL